MNGGAGGGYSSTGYKDPFDSTWSAPPAGGGSPMDGSFYEALPPGRGGGYLSGSYAGRNTGQRRGGSRSGSVLMEDLQDRYGANDMYSETDVGERGACGRVCVGAGKGWG